MSANDPAHIPEEPVAKFRINIQVFQILGLLGIALALPITILVLGVLDIRKTQKKPPEPAPEVPGLRESLETLAGHKWPNPSLDSEMRVFKLLTENPNDAPEKRAEMIDFLTKRFDAGFVEVRKPDGQYWIVALNEDKMADFENELISKGFTNTAEGKGTDVQDEPIKLNAPKEAETGGFVSMKDRSVLYELHWETPK